MNNIYLYTIVVHLKQNIISCTSRQTVCISTPLTLNTQNYRHELWKKNHLSSSQLSLNRQGRWSTTDDFTANFLHFSLFSTSLWDLANSSSVHSLILSSHLFLCLPCVLPPSTVPCKMVLNRPMSAPGKLRALALFAPDRKRFLIRM